MTPEEKFKDAGVNGKEFRGAPFWSWNDDLDPEELRRQIRGMCNAGMGGFFMHTRTGLITPYLSEKYMECHAACIDEARKLGMGAWLYDEDCWPSGFAGGIVPGHGPEYEAKMLSTGILRGGDPSGENLLALFHICRDDGHVTAFERCGAEKLSAESEEEFLAIRVKHCGYVDVLRPKAIASFIDSTHELFKKYFKADFGGAIPGIFTDEPTYMPTPWTEDLPAEFKRRHGYDILDCLPSIFHQAGDWRRVRYDYFRTCMEMYVEAFSKQIGEWCEKEGLAFTGHQLLEETLEMQTTSIGAAMPHYEYMQVPGVDFIVRMLRDPIYVKQVTSAAHQFDKPRVLSETFGCTGWNVTFEDQKWLGEWQYALGINMMCQHLSLYSLRGCRKRDFPPSIFYQQPWWPEYTAVEDHFARLAAALTSGKHVADALIIHPIESEWCVYHTDDTWLSGQFNSPLIDVSDALLEMHIGWDYGDESIMERHASVVGNRFRVGEAEYKLVVLPPMLSIRKSTLGLLEKFIAAGGKVTCVANLPTLVEGIESDDPARVLAGQPVVANEFDEMKEAVLSAISARIEITDRVGNDLRKLIMHQRDLGAKQLFFIANSDKDNGIEALVTIPGEALVEEWDLDTGDIAPVPVSLRNGSTTVSFLFAPAGSRLFSFDPARKPVLGEPERWRIVDEKELGGIWEIERKGPNSITLDCCRYRIADGEWSEPVQTIWLRERLAEIADETPLTLRFTFNTAFKERKSRGINLIQETPEKFEITVNGQKIDYVDNGWWTDISFKKIPIDHLVRPGENVVEITAPYLGWNEVQRRLERVDLASYQGRAYTNPPPDAVDPIVLPFSGEYVDVRQAWNELKYGYELESCYVIGDFNVVRDGSGFVLTDSTDTAESSNLVEQGYPFFRGSVVCSKMIDVAKKPGERIALAFDDVGAVVIKVRVNGKPAGRLVWRPLELDITDLVSDGANMLEIELINSCRNLLGPHHSKDANPYGVGANNFKGLPCFGGMRFENGRFFWRLDGNEPPSDWTDDYVFAPFGLLSAPKIRKMTR
ncbi:MAG: glycosyl hydrolase [Armatimonadota bacterium]|nr:glycosyl hydrolase [Armatimonadota bacterium]